MMEQAWIVTLVAFAAGLTQCMTGFGSALVSMALLPPLLGLRAAAPLVALMAATIEVGLLARYREALRLSVVRNLGVALIVGIPVGLFGLRAVPEWLAMAILGLVLCVYSAYAFFGPRLPELHARIWAWPIGFLGGALGGAYNTSGPPLVIYGHSQHWPPEEFKGNLQGLLLVGDLAVGLSHLFAGNYTAEVLQLYLWAIPGVVIGIIVGLVLDRRLKPTNFRRLVLIVLFSMGVRMLLW
jgi:uncharacterized membrane protein YfcA